MHGLRERKRYGLARVIAQPGLHGDGPEVAARRDLDRFDRGIIGERQRDAVIDAGRPAVLLEIRACGNIRGRTPGCAPTRITISFEPCRRTPETSKIAAEKQGRCSPTLLPFSHTVAPNCALLIRRIATREARESRIAAGTRTSCAAAAKRRHSKPAPRRAPVARHPVLNQFAALELVYVFEPRHRRMTQARDRRVMGISGRLLFPIDRIGDLPLPVQREGDAFRGPERGAARTARSNKSFRTEARFLLLKTSSHYLSV